MPTCACRFYVCCTLVLLLLGISALADPGKAGGAARCRLLLRGGDGSSSSTAVQEARLACVGPVIKLGLNTTHLGRFADRFTGVIVDQAPCAAVAVPAAYDFFADQASEAALTLHPLLCFSGKQRIVFEQLVVEGISLKFDTAAYGSSTALLAFAGSTAATVVQGRISGNSAGSTLLITEKAAVALTAGTQITGNRGITGAAAAVWGGSSLTITNSTLAGNNATLRGGAVYATGTANLVIQSSLFLRNHAELHGGAVYLYDGAVCKIRGTNCTKQTAGGYGACLEAGGAVAVTITGGTWSGNKATWGACFDLLENSAMTTSGGFSCSNNTVSGGSGGAASLSGSAKANLTGQSVFSGNTADSGGAFYAEGDATLTVGDGTRVVGNTAVLSSGGGLWLKGSAVAEIADSDCSSNRGAHGGCIALWEGAEVTFAGSTCSNNTAKQGGCAFLQGSSATLTVEDSSVEGNSAVTGGAFQANDNAQLSLTATEVAGNAASVSGGGAYMSDYSFLQLGKGVRIQNNTAGRYGGGVVLVSNNISSLATLQRAVGSSNQAPYDASLSVLTTNLTLQSPASIAEFVSRLGSDQGVLTVKLAVSGWFGLPNQGILVQAVLPASNNEIIGVNRSAADGSVQLGIKLRRPPGCHNITLTLVEMVDLAVLGVGVPPVGITVCVRECLPGEISTGDACETCRPGTFSLSPESGPVCFACPSPGAVCPGGDLIVSQEGWWHSAPYSAQLHSCRNAAACGGNRSALLAARAAAPSCSSEVPASQAQCLAEQQAAYKSLQCSEGYQGNLCASCRPRYGLTHPFTCHRCLAQAAIVALYTIAAVAMLAVMKLQVHWLLQERQNACYLQDALQPTALVKPLVLYCQYLLMVFSLHTAWPASLSYPLQTPLAWLWSSTSPQALSVECVLPAATGVPVPVVRVLFYLLMPVAMVLALFATEAVAIALGRARGGAGAFYSSLKHRLAGITFVVVFFYFPSIVRTILSLFACVPLDDPVSPPFTANAVGSYWLYDMGQVCYAGYHRAWSLGLGLPMLLLMFVALPASILLLLLCHRDLLYHPSFSSNYGYLYKLYRAPCCWFESIWICFTIVLGTISVFGHVLGAYLQACLMLLALAGMWVVLLLLRPYAHPVAGNMALLAIGCLLITAYGGLLFLPNRAGSLPAFASSSTSLLLSSAGSEAVGALLLLANLAFIMLVLVNLVRVVRWRDVYSSLSQLSTKLSLGSLGPRAASKRGGLGRGPAEASVVTSSGRIVEDVANSRSSSANSQNRLIEFAAGAAVPQQGSVAPSDPAAAALCGNAGANKDPWPRQNCDSRGSSSGRSSGGGGGFWVGRLIAETPVQQYRAAAGRQHRAPPLEAVPDSQQSSQQLPPQHPSTGSYWGRLFGQRSSQSSSGAVRVVHTGGTAAAAAAPSSGVRTSVGPPTAAGAGRAAAPPAAALIVDIDQPASSKGGAGSSRRGADSTLPRSAVGDRFSLPSDGLSNDLLDSNGLSDDDVNDMDSLPAPVPLSTVGTPLATSYRVSPAATATTSSTFASLGPATTASSSLQQTPRKTDAFTDSSSGGLPGRSEPSLLFSPFHMEGAPPAAGGAGGAGGAAGSVSTGQGPGARDDSGASLQSPFFN